MSNGCICCTLREDLLKEVIIALLDAALLTDAELAQGPAKWRKHRDQLPAW